MAAKEMFEKLGYLILENEWSIIFLDKGNETEFRVSFYKGENVYLVQTFNSVVSLELHLAIHQQMKELGWIE